METSCKIIIIGIRNGKWRIEAPDDKGSTFELDDAAGLRKFFREFLGEDGEAEVPILSSSSLNWPEEGGAPEDFDAHGFLAKQVFGCIEREAEGG